MKQINKKMIALVGGVVLVIGLVLMAYVLRDKLALSRGPVIDMHHAMDKDNIVPILIIGSGPSGLSAAIYSVSANIRTVVLQGPLPGGLLTQTSIVENWPGNKSIMGPEIIKNLQDHAVGLSHHYLKNSKDEIDKIEILEDTATHIDASQWPFKVQTANGHTLNALSIIIATGASPKLLQAPGEFEYWKKGVTSCATCDAPFFKDKNVVVAGGGDSAAEQAIQLARHAKNITILVRKEQMRASAIMQSRLKEYPSIKVLYQVQVQEVVGNGEHVTGIKLLSDKNNEIIILPIDGVFLAIGHSPNSKIVKDILAVDAEGYIKVEGRTQATSVNGIFASGDVVDHRYRQASTAAGYGVSAALDAIQFLTLNGFNTTISAKLEKNMFRGQLPRDEKELFVIKSEEDFNQNVIQHEGLVVVDCFMEQCYFCKVMDPIFHEAARYFENRVLFVTLDIDAAPAMAKKLFITSAPTFLVYHNGKLVGRYNGAMNKSEFGLFIEKFLHESP